MNNNAKIEMALGSWIAALLVGTLGGTLLWVLGGWGFLQGAFVGGVIFVVLGIILSVIMTRPLPGPGEVKLKTPPVPSKAAPKTTAPKASAPKAAAPVAAPAPTVARETEAPAPVKAPAKKAAPKKAAAKKAAPKKAEAAASTADDPRPALLTDAPSGAADDLKKISGVGPKLEQTLNDLGVWKYEQVAQFTAKEIAWVDERLRFKGRIERDDWVGQAKALAEGKS